MDKRYECPPFWEEGQGSNNSKQKIPIPGHENELSPRRGPAIRSIQEEGKAIKVRRKRK